MFKSKVRGCASSTNLDAASFIPPTIQPALPSISVGSTPTISAIVTSAPQLPQKARQPGYSFTISPGTYKANETTPRLARDLTRWNQNIKDMVAPGAPFQLTTTFNEWGEGTSVESAQEMGDAVRLRAFLDALHNNGS
jgi:hypothetical protein